MHHALRPATRLPVLLFLAGCAGQGAGVALSRAPADREPAAGGAAAAPVGGAPDVRGAAPASPARRAELRFELDERPFPSPLVDALVGGLPTTMIVDTGASHHVIAAWVAEELGLPLSSAGDVGLDHAGRQVKVSRLEGAGLALSGWGAVDAPALLVVPVPDILRRIGIGGFVSPQSLAAPGGAVVLDLRGGPRGATMTAAPRGEATRALAAHGAAALTELRACGGPDRGIELTAAAMVDGIAVTLKIDTGASQSSIFAGSAAGKRLAPRASGGRSAYAASGKHTVPVLPGAKLRIGALELASDIDLLPGGPRAACPTDGFAGMDALRGCVLVLAEDGGIAACSPP